MRTDVTAIGLVLGACLGFALGPALPGHANAGAGFSISTGSPPDASPKASRAEPRATTPWVVKRPEKADRRRGRRGRDFRHKRHHHRSPYLGHYGGTYYTAPAAPPRPPPPEVEVPPVVVAPPEPAPPPDPHGPLFLSPARGAAVEAQTWQVGDALPPGVPQVTLDWRSYGLPEPPAGRIYARVGRSVLLITASDRVVESVLPPG